MTASACRNWFLAYCFKILYKHYMTTDNKLITFLPKSDILNGLWQHCCIYLKFVSVVHGFGCGFAM